MALQRSRVSAWRILKLVGSMTLFSFGKNQLKAIRSNGPPVRFPLHGASLSVHQGFFEILPAGGTVSDTTGTGARSLCDFIPTDRLLTKNTIHN